MNRLRSVLVYDGRKPAFRTAVDAFVGGVDDIVAVPWESAQIQQFLKAQFGGRPFVFALIEDDSVHAGETAVRRALDARGVSPAIARGFETLYPKIAAPFGRIVHGEVPADIHGTFDLDPEAAAHLKAIRRPE